MSVVVLSYRNEDSVLAAVDSLLGQGEPLEIVVSHSGGGPTPALLAGRPQVEVLASPGRRLPGAARNAGAAVTAAPYVAFLEADCTAAPGWAARRLAHHRRGAHAVASALLPHRDSWIPRAMWLSEHSPRVPTEVPVRGALHGVSYSREALERFGPFDETMVTGEDTVLNHALASAGVEVVWEPGVVSLHRYPETAGALLADAWRRGYRRSADRRVLGYTRRRLVTRALSTPRRAARRGRRPAGPLSDAQVLAALGPMAAVALAKTGGILAGLARGR
jgi:GT2 family glycosyltransferase